MRLITFGDSITQGEHNWASQLAKEINYNLLNFALPASQNLLQIQLLQDWLLNNDLEKDDIVIWQIGLSWGPLLYIDYEKNKKKIDRTERIIKKIFHMSHYHERHNLVDYRKRANLTYISPMRREFINKNHVEDQAEILQNLLFMFIIIKKFSPKLLIVKGHEGWVTEKNWENTKSFLIEKNIDFLDKSIVSWCRDKNLQFMDTIHPTSESMYIYTIEELIPKLKELDWI